MSLQSFWGNASLLEEETQKKKMMKKVKWIDV